MSRLLNMSSSHGFFKLKTLVKRQGSRLGTLLANRDPEFRRIELLAFPSDTGSNILLLAIS
jgi:hypothetical protein